MSEQYSSKTVVDGVKAAGSLRKQITQRLSGKWKSGLFFAPCSLPCGPCCFVYGCCCMPIAAMHQRAQVLEVTGEEYHCFGGLFPTLTRTMRLQGKDRDPACCLCVEGVCCPGLSIYANRFLVQTRFNKESECIDSTLDTGSAACSCCACCTGYCLLCGAKTMDLCCSVLLGGGNMENVHLNNDHFKEIGSCFHGFACCVGGCMQAQHQLEVDELRRQGYKGPTQAVMEALPVLQQQMVNASSEKRTKSLKTVTADPSFDGTPVVCSAPTK